MSFKTGTIKALTFRYAANSPKDHSPQYIVHAAVMKKSYNQFPSDPDIGALYAESLMNLHPWDLYEKHTKKPRPWTPELHNCQVINFSPNSDIDGIIDFSKQKGLTMPLY
ncbi:MAG TPA: hypothetical protein VJ824_15565 [Bacillota bacterium]|nr:hypothetical protein [Bacillota bacterium]